MKWSIIGAAIGAAVGAVLCCIPGVGTCMGAALLAYTVAVIVAAATAVGTVAGLGADVKLGKDAQEAKKEGDEHASDLRASNQRFTSTVDSFGSSSVLSDSASRPRTSSTPTLA